jgi:putative endonuclease
VLLWYVSLTAQHLAGKASKYTRSRLPVALGYAETAADRGSALRREAQIKGLTRDEKLALCRAYATRKKGSR